MKLISFFMILQLSIIVFAEIETTTKTTILTTSINEKNYKEFIEKVEILVSKTTEQALNVTMQVYRNLTKSMTPLLQGAIEPITTEYIRMVEENFKGPRNYSKQRNLLRQFRYKSVQIQRLRLQLQPQITKFEFDLISNDFYSTGKNVTEFDNLYLTFMLEFQRLSETLRDVMSEEMEENEQELLVILDEIAQENQLKEKDKLYDEFIEKFLFKSEIENSELM